MATNGRDMSRAEIFEDEKKRIIDTCFSKRDEDGSSKCLVWQPPSSSARAASLRYVSSRSCITEPPSNRCVVLKTYITHIRILEYLLSPDLPPPPQARTPQAQKPRVIIVAVRKSGRVRVHKSKENPNGTFSIGKTWNLDDLTAIESFTGPNVTPNLQDWAGNVGFVITLGKPYYWQAQTDKEKKFFIASLVKIYGKYTNGRMPEMSNFDQRELDQVLGGAQAPRKQEQSIPRRPPPPEINSSSNLSISSGYNGPLTPKGPPSFDRGLMRSPAGNSSPAPSIESTRGSQQDQTPLRRLAASNRSQDSVAASLAAKSDDGSLRPRSRNGVNGTAYTTPEPPPPPSAEDTPPERKRPPMDPLRPQAADRDLVPAPLMSPGMRREPMVPPRSVERISPRKNSINRRPEPMIDQQAQSETRKPDVPAPGLANQSAPSAESLSSLEPPASVAPTAETPAESPVEPVEETRPGLGPMIKSKNREGDCRRHLEGGGGGFGLQATTGRSCGSAAELEQE